MTWRHPQRLPERIERAARGHRTEPTPAEARLWEHLRRNRLAGAGFRRQHPVGSFILDFYCAATGSPWKWTARSTTPGATTTRRGPSPWRHTASV